MFLFFCKNSFKVVGRVLVLAIHTFLGSTSFLFFRPNGKTFKNTAPQLGLSLECPTASQYSRLSISRLSESCSPDTQIRASLRWFSVHFTDVYTILPIFRYPKMCQKSILFLGVRCPIHERFPWLCLHCFLWNTVTTIVLLFSALGHPANALGHNVDF